MARITKNNVAIREHPNVADGERFDFPLHHDNDSEPPKADDPENRLAIVPDAKSSSSSGGADVDAELNGLSANGHDYTLEAAFREFRDELIAHAYLFVGNHHDAADIVQSVFARFAASDLLSRVRHPKAFLRKSVAHASMDHLKSLHATWMRQAVEIDAPSATVALTDEHSPEIATIAKLELKCVVDAINTMDREHREMLVDYQIMGKTTAEIAEATGLKKRTVQRRIATAINELRRLTEQNSHV